MRVGVKFINRIKAPGDQGLTSNRSHYTGPLHWGPSLPDTRKQACGITWQALSQFQLQNCLHLQFARSLSTGNHIEPKLKNRVEELLKALKKLLANSGTALHSSAKCGPLVPSSPSITPLMMNSVLEKIHKSVGVFPLEDWQRQNCNEWECFWVMCWKISMGLH